MRTGAPPRFHSLDAYTFQYLCRELLARERGIEHCEGNGPSGQRQFGVDLLAYRSDGGNIDAVQCKCVKAMRPAQIRDACNEFLEYWPTRWQPRGVRRFVLVVACDLSRTQLQDELARQRAVFEALGLAFDWWSAQRLRDKLRPHPDIVERYCYPPEYWVQEICGASVAAVVAPEAMALVRRLAGPAVSGLVAFVTSATDSSLDAARESLRAGRSDDAAERLGKLHANTIAWEALPPVTRARALRLEATIALEDEGHIARAKELTDEARALDPAAPRRAEAVIAWRAEGPSGALAELADADDPDSVNLKAALLLSLGRTDEALSLLPDPAGPTDAGAESLRLRALAHLCQRAIGSAVGCVRQAREMRPAWLVTRETAAIIDYYAALSPAALPGLLEAFPLPAPWGLVKRDDASVSGLRSAAAEFERLSGDATLAARHRDEARAWLLACLASDFERQEGAVQFARSLLEATPADFRVLIWVILRHYDLDLTPSIRALRALLRSGAATMNHCIALVAWLLSQGRANAALRELRRSKHLFAADEGPRLYSYWRVEALLGAGTISAAGKEAKKLLPGAFAKAAQESVERARAGAGEDRERLTATLEARYREDGDCRALLELCHVQAMAKEWASVAEHADALLQHVDTVDAARLACIAVANVGDSARCMALLDAAAARFPGGRLPPDLRNVRIECARRLGLLPEALRAAEELARDDDSTHNLLGLAKLHLERGDTRSAASVAVRLVERDDLAPDDSLALSNQIRVEDVELARSLWRKVRELPDLSDEVFLRTYWLAFSLGLEEEARRMNAQLPEVAARRSDLLYAVSLDRALEKIASWHAQRQQIEAEYLAGRVPAHFAIPGLKLSMAYVYHTLAERAERTGSATGPPILIRHGGRGDLEEPGPWSSLQVVADLTALLVAWHLDILDVVESWAGVLHVAAASPAALREMERSALPHQPEQLTAAQAVASLLGEGKILELPRDATDGGGCVATGSPWAELDALVRTAADRGWYVVTFLPLNETALGDLPQGLGELAPQRLLNCRRVVEVLAKAGPLSAPARDTALDALGTEGRKDSIGPEPKLGDSLVLGSGIAQQLARAGVLGLACGQFTLMLPASEADGIHAEIDGAKEQAALAAWVRSLADHVADQATRGRYRHLPVPSRSRGDEAGLPEEGLCLLGALGQQHPPGTVFWCDDRHVTGYESASGAAVVSTVGVLSALREAKRLDDATYFRALLRLRAGNMRFIPLDRDELLYHLANATLAGDEIVESAELRVLRHYFSACLADGSRLQAPGACPNPARTLGELPFVAASLHRVDEAVLGIWKSAEKPVERRQAESNWLIHSLRVDHVGYLPITQDGDAHLLAQELAALLAQALALEPASEPGGTSQRRQYLDWLNENAVQPALRREPGLVVTIAEYLRRFLECDSGEDWSDPERAAYRNAVRHLVHDLPAAVRNELWQDVGFASQMEARTIDAFEFGEFKVAEQEFLAAAERALRAEAASVRDLRDGRALGLSIDQSTEPWSFALVVDETPHHFYGDFLPLLATEVAERMRALRSHPEWFDRARGEMESLAAEIAVRNEPSARLRAAKEAREASAAWRFERLRAKLGEAPLDLTDFEPPPPGSLLRHLRIPLTTGTELFDQAMTQGAGTLLADEGLAEAIRRFSTLPVPLPQPIVDVFLASTADEQARLLEQSIPDSSSPVALLHGLALSARAAASAGQPSSALAQYERLLGSPTVVEESTAFLAALSWTHGAIVRATVFDPCIASATLAAGWIHASTIYGTLRAAGEPASKIRAYFQRAELWTAYEVVCRRQSLWFDIAHPHRVSVESLLVYGVAYAMEWVASIPGEHNPLSALGAAGIARALFPDNQACENSLGSFLGWNSDRLFGPAGPDAAERQFTAEGRLDVIREAVAHLASHPSDSDTWLQLSLIIGDRLPPESERTAVASALEQIEFRSQAAADIERALTVLGAVASQASHADAGARENIKKQILVVASGVQRRVEEAHRNVEKPAIDSMAYHNGLLDACLAASVEFDQPGASAERLARLLREIVAVAPSLAQRAFDIVNWLCQHISLRITKHLWPLLLHLRAQV